MTFRPPQTGPAELLCHPHGETTPGNKSSDSDSANSLIARGSKAFSATSLIFNERFRPPSIGLCHCVACKHARLNDENANVKHTEDYCTGFHFVDS